MSKYFVDMSQPMSAERGRFTIRSVAAKDYDFWNSVLSTSRTDFAAKLVSGTAFVITSDDEYVGLFYHTTLWESLPLLNMVFVRRSFRGRGAGSFAVDFWEQLMYGRGYSKVLVCVPSDMNHQHFYRARGYSDCGSLGLHGRDRSMPVDLILELDF